jgi:2-amino-4-hydroxy-6-hydroxymethyldihydropteridine diphosphokinase
MRQGFILGIGTNVDPERNARHIVERLVYRFGRTLVSRFHYTEPVGMDSDRRFINYCAFIETRLDPGACKSACVAIEVALGRDRTDPLRKTRDRTADIDLLAHLLPGSTTLGLVEVADYLARPLAELTALLALDRAVPDRRGDILPHRLVHSVLGQAPAAVNRDDRAGLVVVGQDRLDGEPDRLGPPSSPSSVCARTRSRASAPCHSLNRMGPGWMTLTFTLGASRLAKDRARF